MKAYWKKQLIAESDETVVVENNYYFPQNSLNMHYFEESATRSTCPWKGEACYYSIVVEGEKNVDAAWYYPNPKEAAKSIKGYVAFWRGVDVVE